jgi:hypothetical protein
MDGSSTATRAGRKYCIKSVGGTPFSSNAKWYEERSVDWSRNRQMLVTFRSTPTKERWPVF